MGQGIAMAVRVSANETTKRVLSQLNELARQNTFGAELKYPCGSRLFGEAEPADYVYQIREGAIRTRKAIGR